MKKSSRYFALCTVVLLMTFGSSVPGNSSAAQQQPQLDPACLSGCQQLQLQCFVNSQTNAEQKKCLAAYRQCIAHCR
ncbi:MAG: hypothetical protein QOG23_3282 [Blastocatellia bacterium]|jgi:hypothetical protein|nr:hypothetical protein [Blastocatellia bacterium]